MSAIMLPDANNVANNVANEEALIRAALSKAVSKHTKWPADPVRAVAILVEEVGEAVSEANKIGYEPSSIENLKDELRQAGAMVLRCLVNLA